MVTGPTDPITFFITFFLISKETLTVRKWTEYILLVTHWPTYAIKRTFQPKHSTSFFTKPTAGLSERHRLVPVTFTGSLGHMQISQLTSLILWNQHRLVPKAARIMLESPFEPGTWSKYADSSWPLLARVYSTWSSKSGIHSSSSRWASNQRAFGNKQIWRQMEGDCVCWLKMLI